MALAAAGFDRLFKACLPLPLVFFGKENVEDLQIGTWKTPCRVQTGGKSHFRSAESLPNENFPGKIAKRTVTAG